MHKLLVVATLGLVFGVLLRRLTLDVREIRYALGHEDGALARADARAQAAGDLAIAARAVAEDTSRGFGGFDLALSLEMADLKARLDKLESAPADSPAPALDPVVSAFGALLAHYRAMAERSPSAMFDALPALESYREQLLAAARAERVGGADSLFDNDHPAVREFLDGPSPMNDPPAA